MTPGDADMQQTPRFVCRSPMQMQSLHPLGWNGQRERDHTAWGARGGLGAPSPHALGLEEGRDRQESGEDSKMGGHAHFGPQGGWWHGLCNFVGLEDRIFDSRTRLGAQDEASVAAGNESAASDNSKRQLILLQEACKPLYADEIMPGEEVGCNAEGMEPVEMSVLSNATTALSTQTPRSNADMSSNPASPVSKQNKHARPRSTEASFDDGTLRIPHILFTPISRPSPNPDIRNGSTPPRCSQIRPLPQILWTDANVNTNLPHGLEDERGKGKRKESEGRANDSSATLDNLSLQSTADASKIAEECVRGVASPPAMDKTLQAGAEEAAGRTAAACMVSERRNERRRETWMKIGSKRRLQPPKSEEAYDLLAPDLVRLYC